MSTDLFLLALKIAIKDVIHTKVLIFMTMYIAVNVILYKCYFKTFIPVFSFSQICWAESTIKC